MTTLINASASSGLVQTADTSAILGLQTNGTTALTIDTSANVGIGTSSPTNRLDIQAAKAKVFATSTTGTNDCYFAANNTGGAFQIGLDNSAGTEFGTAYAGVLCRSGAYPINFYTNANERMRIDSSGNVGIGTASPSTYGLLAVNGNLSILGSNQVKIYNSSNNDQYGIYNNGSTGQATLSFRHASVDAMTLDNSGNLLVGRTSLPAWGDTTGVGFAYDKTYTTTFFVQNQSTNFAATYFNATSYTSGTAYFCQFRVNGATKGNITSDGSTTTYATTSDYRLKEDVQPMTGALVKVSQLKPVTYKWKESGANGQGFIAHELQAVVPDCVSGEKDEVDADGNPRYQGIDTSFLVATLTAAIQEQQTLITAQAETINALTARIVALEGK